MRVLAAIVMMLLALAPAPQAFAHASLIRGEPADGALVAQPPAVLKLIFNEPVSPLVMRIVGPAGEVMMPASVSAENAVITIVPPRLPQGTNVLSWRVVSADGHPIGGSLLFAIGAPTAATADAGVETNSAVKVAIWAAKLALYLGLFVGIGGVVFRALIAKALPPRAQAAIAGALVLGLLAAVLSVVLQGLDALALTPAQIVRPDGWAAGLRTSFGTTAMIAAGALAFGLVSMHASARAFAKPIALVSLAGTGLALAASGHAGTAAPRVLTEPSVFLHAVCVAFWIGSLLPLFLLLRSPPAGDSALKRFTRAIPWPLAVLAASGLYLATVQLDRPDALWTTNYGLVLSAKLALVGSLLALAAANRYWLVPRFERGAAVGASRPLAASIGTELVIAVAILGVVSLWRFTPPPRALAAAEPIAFHIHDPKAMINAALVPRRGQGANLDITVMNAELRPIAVKDVTLVLAYPAAGIEPVRRNATVEPQAGHWRIADLRIPLAGRWDVRVDILIDDFEKVVLEEKVDLPRAP